MNSSSGDQQARPLIADSAPRPNPSTRSTPHIPTLRAVHALLLIALALVFFARIGGAL
jgi:hypothetical protein